MIGLVLVLRTMGRALRRLFTDAEARGLLTLTLALVAVGAWFYRTVEDLSWLDSIYFTIITLTTVGFGDITPETDAGKVFTLLYVLLGIGILVAFVTDLAGHMVAARADLRARRSRGRG